MTITATSSLLRVDPPQFSCIGTLTFELAGSHVSPLTSRYWFPQFHTEAQIRFTPPLRRISSAQYSGSLQIPLGVTCWLQFRYLIDTFDASTVVQGYSSLWFSPAEFTSTFLQCSRPLPWQQPLEVVWSLLLKADFGGSSSIFHTASAKRTLTFLFASVAHSIIFAKKRTNY